MVVVILKEPFRGRVTEESNAEILRFAQNDI
jgi:hypothetical protein